MIFFSRQKIYTREQVKASFCTLLLHLFFFFFGSWYFLFRRNKEKEVGGEKKRKGEKNERKKGGGWIFTAGRERVMKCNMKRTIPPNLVGLSVWVSTMKERRKRGDRGQGPRSRRESLDRRGDWVLETRKGDRDEKRRPGGEQRKQEETAKDETKQRTRSGRGRLDRCKVPQDSDPQAKRNGRVPGVCRKS